MEAEQQKNHYMIPHTNHLLHLVCAMGYHLFYLQLQLPIFSIYLSLKFYEFLSLFGIALLLGSIGLVALGAKKTKEGISVKRFAWGSLIPITMVLFPVMAFMLLNLISYDSVNLGLVPRL